MATLFGQLVEKRRLSDNYIDIPRYICNLRAASFRICTDQSINYSYKKNNVWTVYTYVVARSHVRLLNNRTKNRRRIYLTVSVANVNRYFSSKTLLVYCPILFEQPHGWTTPTLFAHYQMQICVGAPSNVLYVQCFFTLIHLVDVLCSLKVII